jgi:peptidoglycan hydrolase CwlO-like protein
MTDPVWKRIDEHAAIIAEMQRDAAANKAETDTRLAHLESGQKQLLEVALRTEAKIDHNTADIATAKGGLKAGKWIAATLIALGAFALSLWAYIRG